MKSSNNDHPLANVIAVILWENRREKNTTRNKTILFVTLIIMVRLWLCRWNDSQQFSGKQFLYRSFLLIKRCCMWIYNREDTEKKNRFIRRKTIQTYCDIHPRNLYIYCNNKFICSCSAGKFSFLYSDFFYLLLFI